jgi:hypothetical protein
VKRLLAEHTVPGDEEAVGRLDQHLVVLGDPVARKPLFGLGRRQEFMRDVESVRGPFRRRDDWRIRPSRLDRPLAVEQSLAPLPLGLLVDETSDLQSELQYHYQSEEPGSLKSKVTFEEDVDVDRERLRETTRIKIKSVEEKKERNKRVKSLKEKLDPKFN